MTNTSRKTAVALISAAAALTAFTGTANAASYSADEVMGAVHYTAYDFETTQGVDRVHRQVIRVAEGLCGMHSTANISLQAKRISRACTNETLDKTFQMKGIEILASYNAALDESERYNAKHKFAENWSVMKYMMATMTAHESALP